MIHIGIYNHSRKYIDKRLNSYNGEACFIIVFALEWSNYNWSLDVEFLNYLMVVAFFIIRMEMKV